MPYSKHSVQLMGLGPSSQDIIYRWPLPERQPTKWLAYKQFSLSYVIHLSCEIDWLQLPHLWSLELGERMNRWVELCRKLHFQQKEKVKHYSCCSNWPTIYMTLFLHLMCLINDRCFFALVTIMTQPVFLKANQDLSFSYITKK